MPLFLSVIIPAYNEEARLFATLSATAGYFDELLPDKYELIVVDDGSSDRTADIARELQRKHPQIRLLDYGGNRGKGFAVRHGMMHAGGEWRLFCDADLATPLEEYDVVFTKMKNDACEIGIGSRPLRESRLMVHQPWYREALGRGFNKVVQLLAVPGISDTQCGFKIFSERAAVEIFSRCRLDGFAFDAEALYIARRLGYGISEAPIRWSHKAGSKVNMLRDGSRMLLDLARIRHLHRSVEPLVVPPT